MAKDTLLPPFKGPENAFIDNIETAIRDAQHDGEEPGMLVTGFPLIGESTPAALNQMRHGEGVFSAFSKTRMIRTHDAVACSHHLGSWALNPSRLDTDCADWQWLDAECGNPFSLLPEIGKYIKATYTIVELDEVKIVARSSKGILQQAIHSGLLNEVETFGDVLTVYEDVEGTDKLVLMVRDKAVPANRCDPKAFLIEGREVIPVY